MQLWQRWVLRLLRAGSLPKHIAFIMDGNRRFSTRRKCENIDGHMQGFSKLEEVLEWCSELGINTVSVFAFSIENFRRTTKEVEGLFHLAEEKVGELLKSGSLVEKHGVSIRILGDLERLPLHLRCAMARAVKRTRHQTRCVLNVCFAYSSEQELSKASDCIANALHSSELLPCDVTEELVDNTIYSAGSAPVDLLIRTSGEKRLSDFMLWQSSFAVISFVDVFWPQFSLFSFVRSLVEFQLYAPFASKSESRFDCASKRLKSAREMQQYLEGRHEKDDFHAWKGRSRQRVDSFLQRLQQRYRLYIDGLAARDSTTDA